MTEHPPIQEAIANAKKAIGAVGKDEKNQQQGWNFRGIDAVLNAVSGPLASNGITVFPKLQDYTYETVEIGRNKTPMSHVVVKVKYIFLGPAGDCIEPEVAAESFDSGDKAMTKAFSVAYRTALIQALSLPTCEPDPDHDVYERSSREEKPKTSQPRPIQAKGNAALSAPQVHGEITVHNPVFADEVLQGFIKMIEAAKTSDQLNKAWTAIGAKGALQTEIERDGQKVTLEKFLFARNDAIKSGSGN